MNEIHGLIDRLLAERRPDRYDREGGDEWLDAIADEIAPEIPEAQARALHAHKLVRDREKSKTKIANRLLREMFETRQPPLDWMETVNLPLAVGKERVALRALTSRDLRDFANVERREAVNEMATRNVTCEAADYFADLMDSRGWQFLVEVTFGQGD